MKQQIMRFEFINKAQVLFICDKDLHCFNVSVLERTNWSNSSKQLSTDSIKKCVKLN